MPRRSSIPAELDPAGITIIVDTREQLPFDLSPLTTEAGTLATADYSVKGLEQRICLERKSLPDLVTCAGSERERFGRELQRMLAFPARLVIVETSWSQVLYGGWRSSITPQQLSGSILGWMAQGIPFLLAGDRQMAQDAARRWLYQAARHRWREARALVGNVLQVELEAEPAAEASV